LDRDTTTSLQDYLSVLRRQRWLVLATALLVTLAGVGWFLTQTPIYEARTELILERVRTAQDITVQQLLAPTAIDGAAESAAAASLPVAERAAAILGRDDPATLQSQVDITVAEGSQVMRITATDADAFEAASIADAFGTAYIDYRQQEAVESLLGAQAEIDAQGDALRSEIATVDAELDDIGVDPDAAAVVPVEPVEPDVEAGEDGAVEAEIDEVDELTPEEAARAETLVLRRQALQAQLAQVISRSTELGQSADALTGFDAGFTQAQVPTQPTGSDPIRTAAVAFILGLALGIGLAFARDHFDDVVRDEADFKRAVGGRPILGRIPTWKPEGGVDNRLSSLVDPTSHTSEAYRELSAGVRFLLVAKADQPTYETHAHHGLGRSRAVMVSSASMGEGKTSTAANLAVAAARVGLRTVLVDADLRRSSVGKRFGLGRTTGLADVLLNGDEVAEHAIDVGVDNLLVLPAGTTPPNPAELLASPAMRALQAELLNQADLVIYDSPAVLAVPDALEVGPYVDMTILVGRVGETSRRRLNSAIERLGQVGADLSGAVLNGLGAGDDGYYYAYYYQEPEETKKPSRRQKRAEKAEKVEASYQAADAATGDGTKPGRPRRSKKGKAPRGPGVGPGPAARPELTRDEADSPALFAQRQD
jgi:polysaccharide biosynthesis transport protein